VEIAYCLSRRGEHALPVDEELGGNEHFALA
jgi:hypothetical protein